jgi:hypothetical protein
MTFPFNPRCYVGGTRLLVLTKYLPNSPAYSGQVLSDGNLDLINSPFADVWVQVLNLGASPNAGYAYAGVFNDPTTHKLWDWGCENSSICTTTALGAGFNVSCEVSEVSYNLLPTEFNATSGTILYSDISWNKANPNEIRLLMRWKDDPSCVGSYEWRSCTLKAAVVEYPVQIQMNISTTNVYPGPYVSLPAGTSRKDDKIVSILPVADGDGVSNTTYGGIATYFAVYFNSEMNITTWPDTTGTYYPSGQLSTSLSPGIPEAKGDTVGYFHGYCNITFEFPLQEMKNQQMRDGRELIKDVEDNMIIFKTPVDLAEVILEPLRHSMFLASVYQGFGWYGATSNDLGKAIVGNLSIWDDYVQTRPAVQVTPVSRYTVRFYLWGASLAVTHIIILFLIPLFWGFWTLKRQVTDVRLF